MGGASRPPGRMSRVLDRLRDVLRRQPRPGALSLFVSYTRSEATIAHALKTALERQGHRCFAYLLDPIEAADDAALIAVLVARVMESDAVIVVASNASLSRRWVSTEIEIATRRLRRVLLVLVETHGDLDIPGQTAGTASAPWILYRGRNPDDDARRVVRTLRDGRAWGSGQRLPATDKPARHDR
jgi:hypothetical protein